MARADLAQLEPLEQLALVASSTDVLLGMHGAALTYSLYLPPWGALVELWPKNSDMWRCFEHMATMAGLHYARWENSSPAAFRVDASGDYTAVDVAAVASMVAEAAAKVRAQLAARGSAARAAAQAQASG